MKVIGKAGSCWRRRLLLRLKPRNLLLRCSGHPGTSWRWPPSWALMVSLGTLLSGAGGRKGFYWAHAPSPSLGRRGPGNASGTHPCPSICTLACFVPGSGVKVRASRLLLLAPAPSIRAETHRGPSPSPSIPMVSPRRPEGRQDAGAIWWRVSLSTSLSV